MSIFPKFVVCFIIRSDRFLFFLNVATLPDNPAYNVLHMQSQVIRRVIFPSSYATFRRNCANVFQCELSNHGSNFKAYTMPPGVAQISDRQLISEENYAHVCERMCSKTEPMPAIYLWSYDKDGDSPNQRNYEDAVRVKSPSTRGSSVSAGKIKSIYDFCCLACKLDCRNSKGTMNSCHILELEELQGLGVDESQLLLLACGLESIDENRNLIPLCVTCYKHFDNQLLGIALVDSKYTWQVKPDLEQVTMPDLETPYGTLRGTEIIFRTYSPPPQLIAHRHERFLANISSKKKRKVSLRSIL